MNSWLDSLLLDPERSSLTQLLVKASLPMLTALLITACLRRDAAKRHMVLTLAMCGALLCPLVTLGIPHDWTRDVTVCIQPEHRPRATPSITPPTRSAPAEAEPTPLAPPVAIPQNAPTAPPPAKPLAVSTTAPSIEPQVEQSARSEPLLSTTSPQGTDLTTSPGDMVNLLCFLWAVGFSIALLGILRSWWLLRRLMLSTQAIESASLSRILQRALERTGLKQVPQLRVCDSIRSPFVTGTRHPMIVLPRSLCEAAPEESVEAVLLHETAHIARGDTWRVILERVWLGVFWFHPLAYSLRHQLEQAREELCDNFVLRVMDETTYSEVLLKMAKSDSQSQPTLALGFVNFRWNLEKRIHGLLDERRRRMVRTNFWTRWSLITVAGVAMLAIGTARVRAEFPTTQEKQTGPAAAEPDSVQDGVVARVNDALITENELADYLLQTRAKEAVDALVNRQVIANACKKAGITVSDQEIDEEIQKTAKKFGLTTEAWMKTLQKQRRLSEKNYRQDVVWPKVALQKLAQSNDAKVIAQQYDELRGAAEITVDLKHFPSRKKAGKIAFVDMRKVFEASSRFHKQTNALKAQIKILEHQTRQQQDELKRLQKIRRAIKEESALEELDKLIAAKSAGINKITQSARVGFRQSEASIYHNVYKEIREAIAAYADEHGIDLVLKSPGDGKAPSLEESISMNDIDPRNTQRVLQKINETVIYARTQNAAAVDITDAIIKRIEKSRK